MPRLRSRDIFRIAVPAAPMLASAALISMRVLPTLATLWWTILIAAAFVTMLLPSYMARTTKRSPEPSTSEEP